MKLKEFFEGVRSELKRVTWPTKNLVVKATISVIIFTFVIGIYLWVLDLSFTKVLSFIFALRGS